MARTCRTVSWVLVLVAVAAPVMSQDTADTSSEFWFAYQYERKLSDHFKFSGSLGNKESMSSWLFLDDWSRFYLTGAAFHDLNSRLRLAGGLGLYQTFSPEVDDTFEVRLWQQATVYWPDSAGLLRRFVLTHRLKLEERFTHSGDWGLAIRFRYRLATSIPLNTYDLETGSFYVPLAAEFFADVGEEAPEVFAATSRLSAGIGYVLNEKWTIDLRYTRQASRDTVVDGFDTSSHIINFTVRTSIRIKDLLKSH
jgi:hypothetical protein